MKQKSKRLQRPSGNLIKRVIFSFFLIFGFYFIIQMGRVPLIIGMLLINVLMFSEFLKVLLEVKELNGVPIVGEFVQTKAQVLPAGFFWFCFISLLLLKGAKTIFPERSMIWEEIFMPLQVVWVIWFLFLLRGGMYRIKFFYFSLAVVWMLFVMHCTSIAISNLNRGIYYFVFSCVLVCINDTAAYIVGKLCGRTPLTQISPKKTVEGFLGGGILTILLSVPTSIGVEIICKERSLLSFMQMCILGAIASTIAPLGGILSSGYKRAFRVKDFGSLIPGHGGVSDRFDCQLIMQMSTGVFLLHIFRKRTLESFQSEIETQLSRQEIHQLIYSLIKSTQ
ncbi:phosphatidate cytidylyltransferase [Nematocida sp. LUAm3]|nr:phosphatidate cytidylyltransferase [Nematocida sp. LUAm3]KAI5173741.1 phosphatidate cytidylyltransferase [Nematocida sp. LUAm2]KAI5176964.1 phosphatidate cytidylyltransferase [Nematocida sp. LUAm1]